MADDDKEYWRGCSEHDDWEDGCSRCMMNKHVYDNYQMYKVMGET